MAILRIFLLPLAAILELALLLSGYALSYFSITRALANKLVEIGQSMPAFKWYMGNQ
ncbi:hypothetical protein SAMN02744133_10893 [Thalassospira xiamenensis M-5 = DSM 17429]|nr:hypothetical protein SAMN02744133_10893 [Thalassospira xiamenensis M-5 = DSM 17429]